MDGNHGPRVYKELYDEDETGGVEIAIHNRTGERNGTFWDSGTKHAAQGRRKL